MPSRVADSSLNMAFKVVAENVFLSKISPLYHEVHTGAPSGLENVVCVKLVEKIFDKYFKT